MADFTALKTAIQNAIKQNGNEEITGNILQDVLLAIVSTLGDGSINDLITALGSEATTRGNADATLQQNINAEAQARGNADTALGGRIDGVIESINAINAAIGNGYVYAGIATPSSTPVSGKVFYLALTAGTYTNFGATVVPQGINILKYNGLAWSLDSFLGLDDAPTQGSNNLVKSGGVLDSIIKDGSAFDLSVYNNGTTYADLNAALTALNALPAAYKKGGMSMKFVQTYDNKYVQYRLMPDEWSTTVSDWQGVDDKPTEGSENLVKSGGVYNCVGNIVNLNTDNITTGYFRSSSGGVLAELSGFFYSNPIFVSKGNKFKADDVTSTSAQSTIAMLSWVDENNNFISMILNPSGEGTYDYTFDRDGYVSISGRSFEASKYSIEREALKERVEILEKDSFELKKDLADLQSDETELQTQVNGLESYTKRELDKYTKLTSNEIVLNYFRYKSGSITEYNGFFYSIPLKVNAGDVFKATDVEHLSAQTNVAMLSWVDENNNFISLILNPNEAGTYEYEFEESGFVSISGHSTDLSKFSIEGKTLKERVEILENDVKVLPALIDAVYYPDTKLSSEDITSGYFRYKSGSIAEYSSLFYSNPIAVVAGDKFKATNVSSVAAQTNVAMLSWVDENNNFISLILNPSGEGTYEYTFENDGYVSISGVTEELSKYSIIRAAVKKRISNLEELPPQVDELTEKVSNTVQYNNSNCLTVLSENPVKEVRFDCGLFAIFKTVGVIGDSLASGTMQGWNEQGEMAYSEMYELSWGQQLAKMTGVDVYNFSEGGQYAKRWMQGNTARTWDANDEAGGAHSNKKQCYIIGLAHNDYTMVNNGTYTAGIGTVADINDADYTQNADSYVGWYARIIQAIKSIEPRAYIFCITPPDDRFDAYSEQIRNIVTYFSGQRVYLIDLRLYDGTEPTPTSPWRGMGNHLSAAGYLYYAYKIANYIDWIVRNNGADFKYTSLVGTNILDTNPNA